MALSERRPNPAPNTLNRGEESITPRHSPVIEILMEERFMGVRKIIAFPVLLLMTAASTGYAVHEIYQIPPVHRTIDKVLNTPAELFRLITNRDNPSTSSPNGTSTETK